MWEDTAEALLTAFEAEQRRHQSRPSILPIASAVRTNVRGQPSGIRSPDARSRRDGGAADDRGRPLMHPARRAHAKRPPRNDARARRERGEAHFFGLSFL
jgi:hypothetical protein